MKYRYVVWALAFWSAVVRAAEPLSIGPFRTGMTLDELRAAAPQSASMGKRIEDERATRNKKQEAP